MTYLSKLGESSIFTSPKIGKRKSPRAMLSPEYESEEIANCAVKLFSSLITLYNQTLKFAISGQDKASANNGFAGTPGQNQNYRMPSANNNGIDAGDNSGGLSSSYRFSAYSSDFSQASLPPATTRENLGHHSRSNGTGHEYSRRVLGGTLDSINPNRSRHY